MPPPSENGSDVTNIDTFINGIITALRETVVVIDIDEEEHKIDTKYFEQGYIAQIGDKVSVDYEMLKDDTIKYIRIYPDPEDKTEVRGQITHFDGTWGVVADDYLFHKNIFEKKFHVKVGSTVKCCVIGAEVEHEGKNYGFRCTTINLDFGNNNKNHNNNRRRQPLKTEGGVKLLNDTLKFNFIKEGEEKFDVFRLENLTESPEKLKELKFFNTKNQDCFELTPVEQFEPITIEPKELVEVRLCVTAKKNGSRTAKVKFYFEDYFLCGTIKIYTADPKNGIIKDKHYTNDLLHTKGDVIPGEKPVQGPNFTDKRFSQFNIPKEISNILLESGSFDKIKNELIDSCPELFDELCYDNYRHRFNTILFLEEIELYHQMRQYDQEKTRLATENEFLSLQIDGLDERRPSLVIGDKVLLTFDGVKQKHEGWIHHVKKDKILLKFNQQLHKRYNADVVGLQFEFSRTNFKKQHEANSRIYEKVSKDFLFPTQVVFSAPLLNITLNDDEEIVFEGFKRKINFYNPRLNKMQKKAVLNVLRGECRPLPYIIYGPPGTGKTMTLLEIIRQIVSTNDKAHVLVATPSNSSADLITERLHEGDAELHKKFVRVVGHNLIERDSIPQKLRQFCATLELAKDDTVLEHDNKTPDGVLLRMTVKQVIRKKIIIGTCAVIGNLMTQKFPDKHFTHVIIDEAGQLVEPEVMIPISLVSLQGQVILAGDPKQLGPIVFSRFAKFFNLDQSYLDRLLNDFPYSERNQATDSIFNEKLVTHLIDNYRSIPSILRAYNEITYEGMLQSKVTEDPECPEMQVLKRAQPFLREFSDNYSSKKSEKFGLHFVPVNGTNAQEPSSPSWFNQAEINTVVNIYGRLLLDCKFQPDDIGIISPYKLQCKKILDLLREKRLTVFPKIGSVEEFQGQERDVMIISTVRTYKTEKDAKFSLGFVSEKRRMNVSISRAKSILFIIGCPQILQTDENWSQLIKYAKEYKTYHGN